MRKKALPAGIAVIIILATCLSIHFFRSAKPILFLDNIHFGSSPRQVTRLLGEPLTVNHDVAGTGKTVYTYKATVLESEATVTCYFINNKQLSEVSLTWGENSINLYDRIYTCLYDHYSSNAHFFVKQDTSSANQIKTSIGIDNGVTGLFYTIHSVDTSITVLCIDNS